MAGVGNESGSFEKLKGGPPVASQRALLEVAMNDCVNSVLSRYAISLDKKRDVPLISGSLWDYDPSSLKRQRLGKNSNFRDPCAEVSKCHSIPFSSNYVHDNENGTHKGFTFQHSCLREDVASEPFVDALFPDLPQHVQRASSCLQSERMPVKPLKSSSHYSVEQNKKRSSRRNFPVSHPSFEEWKKQRFYQIQPSPENEVSSESAVSYPPTPVERNILHRIENNFFYGVVEGSEEASEDVTDNESVNSAEPDDQPPVETLMPVVSVSSAVKKAGFVPNGTNKNPPGYRLHPSGYNDKHFYVGSFKQILLRKRHFFIRPEDFLTLKVSDGCKQEKLVVLGLEILEIRNVFPLLFKFIASLNFKGIAVPFSCSAVVAVIKYAFQVSYQITDWRVGIEVWKIASVLELPVLEENVKQYFVYNPVSMADVIEISAFADDLQSLYMLDNILVSDLNQPWPKKGLFSFHKNTCSVSYSVGEKPKEPCSLNIPLQYCKSSGDLSMIRKTDIKNQVEIESVKNLKLIGIEMKFELGSVYVGNEVQVFCEVLQGEKQVLDFEKLVKLKPLVPLMFDKKIPISGNKIIMNIIIEDIKSSICYYVEEKDVIKNECLRANLKSNNKNSAKKSLYFVSKVFYI